MEKKENKF